MIQEDSWTRKGRWKNYYYYYHHYYYHYHYYYYHHYYYYYFFFSFVYQQNDEWLVPRVRNTRHSAAVRLQPLQL